MKIPLESSKDTRDYKDNVLDDNTNGIGGSSILGSKAKNSSKTDKYEKMLAESKDKDEKEDDKQKLLANPKQARISVDV